MRPSQGLPVKRLPRLYLHRFFQNVRGVLFACLAVLLTIFLARQYLWLTCRRNTLCLMYLHSLMSTPPPNIAMMVRHSSTSRLLIRSKRNQILWDFFVSTQRAPHYFPQTTQILSVSQMGVQVHSWPLTLEEQMMTMKRATLR
jgi:hypothetical protein